MREQVQMPRVRETRDEHCRRPHLKLHLQLTMELRTSLRIGIFALRLARSRWELAGERTVLKMLVSTRIPCKYWCDLTITVVLRSVTATQAICQ